MAQTLTEVLTESDRCPKCDTRTLERDPEEDIHCWGCGTTFLQEHEEIAVEEPTPIVESPEEIITKIEPPPIHKKIDLSMEPFQPPAESAKSSKSEQRGRVKGTKVGHYRKVACKVEQVITLYNEGYSIRPIAQELSLACNTVKGILKENLHLVNHAEAEKLKKARIKRSKETITHALIGLASSAKSSNHSYEWMFENAGNILALYFKKDPVGTVKSLVGDKSFSVDDLFKKAYEITLGQRLRLDERFTEVEEGVFKLVNS